MSTTRSCGHCGAEVPEGYRFCTSCGTPVEVAAAAPATAPVPVRSTPSPTAPAAAPASSFAAGTFTPTESVRRIEGIGVTPATGDADPEGVRLAAGESVQRRYALHPRQRPLGTARGTLLVTTARVIYVAEARTKVGRSIAASEVQLRDVNGVTLDVRKGMSARDLSSWLLATIIWFFLLPWLGSMVLGIGGSDYGTSSSEVSAGVLFLLLVWLLGAVLSAWLKWRGREIELVVRGRRGEAVAVAVEGGIAKNTIGSVLARLRSPGTTVLRAAGIVDADMAAVGVDLESAQAMYAEIGALVLDLQARQAAAER